MAKWDKIQNYKKYPARIFAILSTCIFGISTCCSIRASVPRILIVSANDYMVDKLKGKEAYFILFQSKQNLTQKQKEFFQEIHTFYHLTEYEKVIKKPRKSMSVLHFMQ